MNTIDNNNNNLRWLRRKCLCLRLIGVWWNVHLNDKTKRKKKNQECVIEKNKDYGSNTYTLINCICYLFNI